MARCSKNKKTGFSAPETRSCFPGGVSGTRTNRTQSTAALTPFQVLRVLVLYQKMTCPKAKAEFYCDNYYAKKCVTTGNSFQGGTYVDGDCSKMPSGTPPSAAHGSKGGACAPASYNFFQIDGQPTQCFFAGINKSGIPVSPYGKFYQSSCCAGTGGQARADYDCFGNTCRFVGSDRGKWADPNCGGNCTYDPSELQYKCQGGKCVKTPPGQGNFLDPHCGVAGMCGMMDT